MHVPYVEQLKHFCADEIDGVLRTCRDVSLCADTTRPRPRLRFYEDADIEVRMSRYSAFTACTPCRHRGAQEFKFVVKGAVKVLLFGSDLEYSLLQGSLFIVDGNMSYCMKCMPGTQILTFALPDDRALPDEELPVGDKLRVWMSSWSGNPVVRTEEAAPALEMAL